MKHLVVPLKGAVQTVEITVLYFTQIIMQFTHFSGIYNGASCLYALSGGRVRCAHCDLFNRCAPVDVPVAPVAQPVVPVVQAAQSRIPMTATEVADITAMFVKKHQERLARQRSLPNMAITDTNDLQKNDIIRVEIGNKHETFVVNANKSVLLVQDFNGVRPMDAYPSIYSYLATLTLAGVKFHNVSLNSKTSDYNYPHQQPALYK